MQRLSKLRKHFSRAHFKLNLPLISYEISLDDLLNSRSIDERIARLGEIKKDLQAAVDAVNSLQSEAQERKSEVDNLQQTVKKLEEDKSTAEALLQVPEESFARLIARAGARGRLRGIIEGLVIGLLTGALSSLLVWYLTKGH